MAFRSETGKKSEKVGLLDPDFNHGFHGCTRMAGKSRMGNCRLPIADLRLARGPFQPFRITRGRMEDWKFRWTMPFLRASVVLVKRNRLQESLVRLNRGSAEF